MRVPVPLAGLRAVLDDGSAHAHWSVAPDGVRGRAWVIATDAPVTVPLVLDRPVRLTARARLTPHDWRDSVAGVIAWLSARTAGGDDRRIWTSALTPAAEFEGVSIDCLVPADATALVTGAAPREMGPRSTGRFLLIDPYLSDPGEAPQPSPVDPAAPRPDDGPVISVLCPVHDPPAWMLREAIASVLAQSYPRWQLVLVDDGSADPGVIATLDEHESLDPRIIVVRHPAAVGIAAATNAGLARAAGDYVATLDHDDLLDRHALAYVAAAINHDAGLDMVYTDEAVLDEGRVTARHRKPGWSPETLAVRMYTNHLAVFRRSLAVDLGGFRSEFDGTQDYDFVLRLGDRTDRIAHIPEILYFWRAHAGSTAAAGQAKPYAYAIQPRAVTEHLGRRGVDGEVQYGPRPGIHRIVHRVERVARVSVVVLVQDVDAWLAGLDSWVGRPGCPIELVVSVPEASVGLTESALFRAEPDGSHSVVCGRELRLPGGSALQAAAGRAGGRQLLLMDAPMRGLTHDWLARLVGYGVQPGIGAAAPIVLSADDRIAHAGVAIPDRMPLPILHGSPGPGAPEGAYNVIAADGAIAITAETLERLGGLDGGLSSTAIADLCLRAGGELGLRTVIVDDVRLRAIGPDRAVNDLPELWRLGERCARRRGRDPYYNPGFLADRADFHVREPS